MEIQNPIFKTLLFVSFPSWFSDDIYKAGDSWKLLTSWKRKLARGRKTKASINLNSLESLNFLSPLTLTFWLWLHSHEHSDENQNNSVKHLGVCPSRDKTFVWPMVQTEAAVFVLQAAWICRVFFKIIF